MSIIIVALALLGYMLFLSEKTQLPKPVLPFVVLTASPVWLLPFGMANLLFVGAVLWCILGVVALAFIFMQKKYKDALANLYHPALLLFAFASLSIWGIFATTQPMFNQWDEFTFWGAAIQRTVTQDVLHPVSTGYLAARSYPPSLMLISYLFQGISLNFDEWQAYSAYAILMFSAYCAICAVFEKNAPWYKSAIVFCTGLVLPYFFTTIDYAQTAYLTVMSDTMLGVIFGGALCLYFTAGHKKSGLIALSISLTFLTLIKEIGLAYAAIVVGVAFVDMVFVRPKFNIKNIGAKIAIAIALITPTLIGYLGWVQYIKVVTGTDKSVVGNDTTGTVVGYGFLITDGILQFLGMGSANNTEKFQLVSNSMNAAFLHLPVSVIGSGFWIIAFFALLFMGTFYIAQKGEMRRRLIWFAITSTGAFVAFMLFHLLLYVYNFSDMEALALKDYQRYIGPFYLGWFMAIFCVLLAMYKGIKRPHMAEYFALLTALVVSVIGVSFGLPIQGFWNASHEQYTARLQVAERAEQINQFLTPNDKVLLLSQEDDGTRWYYYGYELEAELALGYGGENWADEDSAHWLTTFSSIVAPDAENIQYLYPAKASLEDYTAFLNETKYTHLILDISDSYIAEEFAPLFDGEVYDSILDGAALYKINYLENGKVQFELIVEVA